MKIFLAVLTAFCITFPTPMYAAANCVQAQRLYRQALQAKESNNALSLLETAERLCANYAILYQTAVIYLDSHQPQEALAALNKAGTYADGGKYVAYIFARKAQAYWLLKQRSAASAAANSAFTKLAADNIPDWLHTLRKQIDLQQSRQALSADFISHTLNTMKSYGVSPKIDMKILFVTDSAALTPAGTAQVEALQQALILQVQQGYQVLLLGHTDIRGTHAYNQALSERRSEAVLQALFRANPALSGHVNAKGEGETNLRYVGTSTQDHLLNRRVEVRLLK